MKIKVYPMDYEEFCDATRGNYSIVKEICRNNKSIGQQVNRSLMRSLRIYMAVGGMPQAVEAYTNGNNFAQIDQIKRQIISLYEDDFKKIDSTGKLSMFFRSIPAQLSKDTKRYNLSRATGKKATKKDHNLIYELLDSKTILISYNTTDPRVSLSLTKDLNSYKLYLCDTGLFVTLMFIDKPSSDNKLYAQLLSDKLPANLGYLYENLVAQIISAFDRDLYYHTWEKENSTHYYEIDFLITKGKKTNIIEVKSSGIGKHESLDEFSKKYSECVGERIIFSQKDFAKDNMINYLPFYAAPIYFE